jgi:RNA-directed DNA polymerase
MTKTSIGIQELRKRLADKAKAEKQHRFWGLYTHVWKLDLLEESYRLAKNNGGSPGIDNVNFDQIEDYGVSKFLEEISGELREKTYLPLASKQVEIPKSNGKMRILKIPAIRDRVVQGALRIIMEPIFEQDFQRGSYGFRPNKSAHEALERVNEGLNKCLHHVIDFDLKSYFDLVKHDKLLRKIAERINDDDIMWLCKKILKTSGNIGLPQGSVIGPLWSNLYLNEVDKMLEKAQTVSKEGKYERIRYTRFADDLIVQVSDQKHAVHWQIKVEKRLRQELDRLDVVINEEKSKVIKFKVGAAFDFLGYTFRCTENRTKPGRITVISHPQKAKRSKLLKEIQAVLNKSLSRPVKEVVQRYINPRVRGWVNYFRWGNSGYDLNYVKWQVDMKIRRFASRQTPKSRGGNSWTKWSATEIYSMWGLYSDYRVSWCAARPVS